MSESKPLIDPKELVPAAVGFVLGFGILALLGSVALGMNLALLAETWMLPRQ
ncbi:MAG: hypothetical protein ACK5S5_12480 [Planctomycetota bacterium]|jgi:hypothetical protein